MRCTDSITGRRWAFAGLLFAGQAAGGPPIADVHLHWKWNQREVTTPAEAVATLDAQDVGLAVVTGTPPELALELAAAAPARVVPIYGIYRTAGDWATWHRDPDLVARVRQALASGAYFGIGEVHMIGGFISHWRNPVIAGLFDLAAEFDVPALVHIEFSRADYTIGLCQAHPKTRFLLAHAGSMLPAGEVKRALDACPRLHVELSARDPWRHRRNRITDADGHLLADWFELVTAYADRFMIGSDPVWPVTRLNPWDEPDTGWQELPRFLDFHRGWLATLPQAQADAIRWDNARRLFRAEAAPSDRDATPLPAR